MITKTFENAVESENIRGLRIMMKDSLLVDPTFKEFREMEKRTANVSGLYDEHDGRPFVQNQAQWTDDYMDKLMVQVVGNFSHERLEHLMDVVRYLRPIVQSTKSTVNQEVHQKTVPKGVVHKNYNEQRRDDQRNGRYIRNGAVFGAGVGAVGGGIAACAAGCSAMGVTGGIIGGAVAGAAIGAIAGYMIGNGGK